MELLSIINIYVNHHDLPTDSPTRAAWETIKHFSILERNHCRGNVFTEPLNSNGRRYTYIDTDAVEIGHGPLRGPDTKTNWPTDRRS
jgi:hypothetical protein